MAPPAGPAPLNFIIQTTTPTGHLTTLTTSTEATAIYLEQLIRGFQDAINTRQLSSTTPAWRHLSDRYEMGPKRPLYRSIIAGLVHDARWCGGESGGAEKVLREVPGLSDGVSGSDDGG